MFDKRKDNLREPAPQREPVRMEERPLSPAPVEQPPPAPKAAIGSTIIIKGELSGDEDVVVSGEFEGHIDLPNHSLTVLRGGQVRANVKANMIEIQGEVQGDVDGVDKVLITKTGRMQGNISSPRVVLDDGAIFKGSIDMEPPVPAPPKPAPQPKPAATPAAPKPAAQTQPGQRSGSPT